MQIFKEFLPYRVTERPCVFTFGCFDGVHLGHQHLFRRVLEKAENQNAASCVLTFRNHPSEILRPSAAPQMIMTPEEKLSLIESFGFDYAIDLAFTPIIARLTRDDFLMAIYTMFPLSCIIVGEDVTFGKDRQGDKEYLVEKGVALGFEVEILAKFCLEGTPVSSSLIRALIAQGDFQKASKLSGREK